jgi:multisubunit Na+/H+ antiporter MnhC subunit
MRTWGLVLALILFSGIATVSVPWIGSQFGGGGGGGGATVERGPLVIPVPEFLAELLPASMVDGTQLTLQPIIAVLILAVVVIGGVAVTGAALAFVLTRVEHTVSETKSNEVFQKGIKAFAEAEKQHIANLRERAAKPKPVPSHVMPRWSVISTSLIFIVFSIFGGTLISDTLYPGREMELGGNLVDPHGVFIAGAAILALIVLTLVFRPRFTATGQTVDGDTAAGIPWDMVYVIITGMIFIAIGVGLVLWLRSAPLLQ